MHTNDSSGRETAALDKRKGSLLSSGFKYRAFGTREYTGHL